MCKRFKGIKIETQHSHLPSQLAAAYFSPRKGSTYAKRLHNFEIVALRACFLN